MEPLKINLHQHFCEAIRLYQYLAFNVFFSLNPPLKVTRGQRGHHEGSLFPAFLGDTIPCTVDHDQTLALQNTELGVLVDAHVSHWVPAFFAEHFTCSTTYDIILEIWNRRNDLDIFHDVLVYGRMVGIFDLLDVGGHADEVSAWIAGDLEFSQIRLGSFAVFEGNVSSDFLGLLDFSDSTKHRLFVRAQLCPYSFNGSVHHDLSHLI